MPDAPATPASAPAPAGLRWDLFCRVIDNHGDIGVCWRLAALLGRQGHRVRLWVDDASALPWLAPQGAPGVQVLHWPIGTDIPTEQAALARDTDVVIEAFGCDPPPAYLQALPRPGDGQATPVWINLEYLSAEDYVERSHALASPQWHGPGAGLTKWFFYPGFTDRTGGLMHEDVDAQADNDRWLAARGWAAQPGERSLLLFGYSAQPLPGLLRWLGDAPTLLRLAAGPLQEAVAALPLPPAVRLLNLPHVPQPDFDRLLAASDLNLVRGEDSFARAQLASDAPFLWQIYPQDDGAHQAKLAAFLDLYLAGAAGGPADGPERPPEPGPTLRQAFAAWNGLAHWPASPLSAVDRGAWQALHRAHRARLRQRPCLSRQLTEFALRQRLSGDGHKAR